MVSYTQDTVTFKTIMTPIQQSPTAIKTEPGHGWNEWASSINESIYNREWSPLASDSSTNLLLRMGGNFQNFVACWSPFNGERNTLRDFPTRKLPLTLCTTIAYKLKSAPIAHLTWFDYYSAKATRCLYNLYIHKQTALFKVRQHNNRLLQPTKSATYQIKQKRCVITAKISVEKSTTLSGFKKNCTLNFRVENGAINNTWVCRTKLWLRSSVPTHYEFRSSRAWAKPR